jgi:hypothetical protein
MRNFGNFIGSAPRPQSFSAQAGVWGLNEMFGWRLRGAWPFYNLADLFKFDFSTGWNSGAAPTTYTNGPTHGRGSNAFLGGVLTPSGKVVLVPANSTTIGIYDPVADTYTNGPTHGRGTSAFYGGVLTPSGKVVLVPANSTTIGIFEGGATIPVGDEYALTGAYLNKL